jgi:GT2 family glycosyltransferase
MTAGLLMSSGEIFVRTDDDVEVEDDWLSEIAKTFDASDDIGGVTGPTLIPSERLSFRDVFMLSGASKISWPLRVPRAVYDKVFLEGEPKTVGRVFRSGAFSLGSNFKEILNRRELLRVDYLEACNMAVRRRLIDQVGGFDPSYRSIGDWSEMDLSFRVRKLGYKLVFNPRAIVHHMVSRSGIFKQRDRADDRMRNFVHFYFRHIRPDNLDKCVRFGTYLTFLQAYWIYKSMSTGNVRYLGGITGTLRGLSTEMRELTQTSSLRN